MNIIISYPIDTKWKPQTSGCSLILLTAIFCVALLISVRILLTIIGLGGVLLLYGGIATLLIAMTIWKEKHLQQKALQQNLHLQFENEGFRLVSDSLNSFFHYRKQLKELSFRQYEYDDGSDKKVRRMLVKWQTLENESYEYALDIVPDKLEPVISYLLKNRINFSMYDDKGNFTDFLNVDNQSSKPQEIDKNILKLIDEIGENDNN